MNPFIIDTYTTAHPFDVLIADEALCRAMEAHYIDDHCFEDADIAELFAEESGLR